MEYSNSRTFQGLSRAWNFFSKFQDFSRTLWTLCNSRGRQSLQWIASSDYICAERLKLNSQGVGKEDGQRVCHWIKERYITAVSSDLHSLTFIWVSRAVCRMQIGLPTARSHQLANTGRYCEWNGTLITRRQQASVDLRTVATEFCSDGLYSISRNSLVREFFSQNRKFFRDPGKSSSVNIPNLNCCYLTIK